MRGTTAVAILIGTLAGCTTMLKSDHVDMSKTLIPTGAVYYLPTTGFEVSLQFRLTQCRDIGGAYRFEYDVVSSETKQRFIQDPAEAYALDYAALNSALKMTNAKLSFYPNGMLKTINADVDDRTSQVVSSAAGVAINLAKASAFAPITLFGASIKPCPQYISTKLKQYDELTAAVRSAAAADKALSEDKGALDDAHVALDKAQAALDTLDEKAPDAERAKRKSAVLSAKALVDRLAADINSRKPQMPAASDKLRAISAQLTRTVHQFWKPTFGQTCSPLSVDQREIAKNMFDPEELAGTGDDTENGKPQKKKANDHGKGKPAEKDRWQTFQDDLDKVDEAKLQGTVCVSGYASGTSVNQIDRASEGLVYRIPATAQLEIRKGDAKGPIVQFSDAPVSIPQFGSKGILTLNNGPFDKNQLVVAFQEDGSLGSVDFVAQSQAERAAGSLQDLSKAYAQYMEERQKAQIQRESAQDDATKRARDREIADLDFKIAELTKLREVETTRAGIKDRIDTQKGQVDKETELIESQIKLLDAQKRLEQAKAGK